MAVSPTAVPTAELLRGEAIVRAVPPDQPRHDETAHTPSPSMLKHLLKGEGDVAECQRLAARAARSKLCRNGTKPRRTKIKRAVNLPDGVEDIYQRVVLLHPHMTLRHRLRVWGCLAAAHRSVQVRSDIRSRRLPLRIEWETEHSTPVGGIK